MDTYRKIKTYIDHNPLATLGTINAEGEPQGAAVYACADNNHPIVYFITKQGTRKYQNLSERDQVSLTIINPSENSTLQATGQAFEVKDAVTIDKVVARITQEHASADHWLPPLAKIRAGAYVIIGVTLTQARLAQFQGMSIGSEHIFTQL